jgi:hypothetical protein
MEMLLVLPLLTNIKISEFFVSQIVISLTKVKKDQNK